MIRLFALLVAASAATYSPDTDADTDADAGMLTVTVLHAADNLDTYRAWSDLDVFAGLDWPAPEPLPVVTDADADAERAALVLARPELVEHRHAPIRVRAGGWIL